MLADHIPHTNAPSRLHHMIELRPKTWARGTAKKGPNATPATAEEIWSTGACLAVFSTHIRQATHRVRELDQRLMVDSRLGRETELICEAWCGTSERCQRQDGKRYELLPLRPVLSLSCVSNYTGDVRDTAAVLPEGPQDRKRAGEPV